MRERCVLVRPSERAGGKTGATHAASTAGAQGLCLELATRPPGARGRAHLHADHESAAYVLQGAIALCAVPLPALDELPSLRSETA